ncbi:MAG: beta strand repeat-containing protein [Isosphaerales bacterium]
MSLRLSSVHRSTSRARQHTRARRNRQLWALEGLEDRVLLSPTPYMVINSSNEPTVMGSLPWAVNQANNQGSTGYAPADSDGSAIMFNIPTTDPGYDPTTGSWTITLSSTLELSESDGPEVIDGPGGNLVTISGNNAVGAFQVDAGVTATISGLTITGGQATNGGGINSAGTLTVTDSTIESSNASNNGGGIDNLGTLTVTDSTIERSSAGNNGGGIDNSGTLAVTDSTIESSLAGSSPSGGIENSGTLTLTNSTIADNNSGIDNFGTLTAVNTTIAYNAPYFASTGGGLYDETGSTSILDNTIVALNTNTYSAPEDITGGPVSSASAYNLIGTGGSGGLTNGRNGNLVGVADPGLPAELANNGGPTQTIALLAGSPAIGMGGSTIQGVVVPTTDQRGFTRPGYGNGVVDIGAFESPAFGTPTHYTVDVATDNDPTSGGSGSGATGDLRYCITQANANTDPAGSVITFDPTVFNSSSPQTINLTGTLDLSEEAWPEVIQGPGSNVVTISGNDAVRVFEVGSATTATVSGLTISGGSAPGNQGGGIDNFGSLTVTGCTIADNTALEGAGIMNGGSDTYGGTLTFPVLTVTDCTISGNSASNLSGGIESDNVETITDSTIEGNSAFEGAGILSFGFSVLTNCTIADNTADYPIGGGVFNFAGATILTNSTITENAGAPGVEAAFSASSMRVTDCTIADNPGGGIFISAGALTIENSIVAHNGDSSGTDDFGVGPNTPLVAYNNLVGVDEFGTLTNGVNGNIVGVDPLLGPLANNGGPTETMALSPGSPAIDTGSATIPGVTFPNTDQRGALRGPAGLNAGSTVDIGAYEASSSYLVTSTAASTDVGTLQTAIGWAHVSTNANPANAPSPAPNTIVFAAPDTQSLDQDLAAISSLAVSNTSPLPITIDLSLNTTYQNVDGGGNTVPIDATAPTDVALTLNGPPSGTATLYDLVTSGAVTVQGNITVIGKSPALVVNSGQTTITDGVTLVTATNAPTIQVNGGTLVVRDSTVEQNSTTSSQPAILITVGSVNLGTAASPGDNTLNVDGTGTLIQNSTASPVPAVGDTFENKGTAVASSFGVVSLSTPPAQTANQGVPKPFSVGSLTDTVTDSQSWAVDVNWGDSSAHTDFNATSTGPLSAQPHAFPIPGTYTVTVTATDPVGSGATAWEFVQSFTVTVAPSIFVLDPSAGGALSLSGNASLKIPGAVVVASTSSTALSASGNALVKASVIDVHGGVQTSGNASFSPSPTTGAAMLADPLASLASPSTSGLTNYGSESLSGNSSATIKPGIYSQINVSGNAKLTLNPGTYIIEGGGLTVTGNASVSGTGVMIYNAGSNYPNSGGSFGGITLSGNGTFNLTAPTTGPYAGVLIFQSHQNTRALSFSGNAVAGTTGIIYAPSALISLGGNCQLQSSLDVDMLNLSGNVALTQLAAGSDGAGDTSGIANTLLAGNLSVYINDPNGYFTTDELARIQDAINAWDAVLAPYNVTITAVNDPSLASSVLDTGTSSACGGVANGVLGCYNEPASEMTIIQGWNWYAGPDPSQIGPGQYDFETTVMHELGHALGLGGSTDPSSPMHETLAAGTTARTVTTQDLNIPDPPAGADPQTAAGFNFGAASGSFSQNGYPLAINSGSSLGPVGLMPLSAAAVTGTQVPSNLTPQQPAWSAGQAAIDFQIGSQPSLALQAMQREVEHGLDVTKSRTGQVPDSVVDELASDLVRLRVQKASGTTDVSALPFAGLPVAPVPIDLRPRGAGLQPVSETPTGRVRVTQPVPEIPAGKMAVPQSDSPWQPPGFAARLAVILLAAGPCGYASGIFDPRNPRSAGVRQKRKSRFLADLHAAWRR